MGVEGTMAMEKARRGPQNWRWQQSETSFMTKAGAPLPISGSSGGPAAGFHSETSKVFSVSKPVSTSSRLMRSRTKRPGTLTRQSSASAYSDAGTIIGTSMAVGAAPIICCCPPTYAGASW